MTLFSDYFSGLATIFTGLIVVIIYYRQKSDSKVQAARVLLTEIRIAEERIDQIRDKMNSNSTLDLPSVFPTKSWKNYSYLFISDFDQDELKLINSFYDYGEQIEESAKRSNDFFWINVEERAKVTLQKLAKYIDESFGTENPSQGITQKRDFLSKNLDDFNLPYNPQKTLESVKTYLSQIQKITTSSCGLKLKIGRAHV